MEISFSDELECLKASYDTREFMHFISSNSHILKFTVCDDDTCVTFEIPENYPQVIPVISVSSTKISNAQKTLIENEIKCYAEGIIGSPIIMDLVIKFQEIFNSYLNKYVPSKMKTLESEDDYMAIIQIDHMRQKKRYLKTLISWASDLSIVGSIIFCYKWIFLILQSSRENVKEFIIRHRTCCIDVDSAGKPCKERMSKIIFEGNAKKCFASFSVEELLSFEDLEEYLKCRNLDIVYQHIFKPMLFKS
ncbi:RWD domain-containing protein 3 [Caerostris darwini]|uniref:RWD domain-containing protein 3 n=1 Tax=Caerostris darwini TaxID=1538125 RepID=A0AAV4SZW6_9ARAC|nr:RWD domain-containing protein 3 [Caerostris darwini]